MPLFAGTRSVDVVKKPGMFSLYWMVTRTIPLLTRLEMAPV